MNIDNECILIILIYCIPQSWDTYAYYVIYLLIIGSYTISANGKKLIIDFFISATQQYPDLMLCRGVCRLIAHSWLDLAHSDTQRPVVSKKRGESTRSKSQISPEWAERHKFSPTDCCPHHVPPIERTNNEHSRHRLPRQGQGPAAVECHREWRHHSQEDRGKRQGWRRY